MLTKLLKLLNEQDPEKGLTEIVEFLNVNGMYSKPSIYFLSVIDGKFKKIIGNSSSSYLPSNYIKNNDIYIRSKRENCTIALITGQRLKDIPLDVIDLISGLLLYFYDLQFFITYFQEIRKPIDFVKSSTYYVETAELLSSALGMPLVAIRRLTTSNSLKGLCFYDATTKGQDNIGKDFDMENMPIPFQSALKEAEDLIVSDKLDQMQPIFHSNIAPHDKNYKFLYEDKILSDVKSFVIFPVVNGHELFGMMSCASRCDYVFSYAQEKAVAGLMQIIGIAISNFLKYHEAQELEALRTEQIIDTTAVEIAKSTKHELSNAQAEVSTIVWSIKKLFERNQLSQIQEELEKLEISVDKILPMIQKLSFGDMGDRGLEDTSIKNIWDTVIGLFSERLKGMSVNIHYQGPDCNGKFYPEMLQYAFLNLILNSIDAFKTHRKRGRKITLVATVVQKGKYCQLDYSDNAGGINLSTSSYRIPDSVYNTHPGLPLKELIFLPKVSSKGGLGSGWGLFLVRRAISMHKGGSIDLLNYRNGCTFRIVLPLKLIND